MNTIRIAINRRIDALGVTTEAVCKATGGALCYRTLINFRAGKADIYGARLLALFAALGFDVVERPLTDPALSWASAARAYEPADAVRRKPTRKRMEIDAWLCTRLADHQPHLAADVRRDFDAAKLGESTTLYRVAHRIGVIFEKPIGLGGAGRWTLPRPSGDKQEIGVSA